MKPTFKTILSVLAIILVCIFPLLADSYILYIGWLAIILSILAVSLGLIMGYTGQPSFCHATFYAIGAYASVLFVTELNVPVWFGLIMSLIVSGCFGLMIGYVALRLRGAYFALITLAFALICSIVASNPSAITQGTIGIRNIPSLEPAAVFDDMRFYFYIVFMVFLLTMFLLKRIINSRVGRAYVAIRENEEFASSIGVNPMKYKLQAFVIGSMLAGIAGALYAHGTHFINSSLFDQTFSFEVVMMAAIGGLGTLAGPVVGAVMLAALPEYLRSVGTYRLIIYGIILILVLRFMPGGIIGAYYVIIAKLKEKLGKEGEITNAEHS